MWALVSVVWVSAVAAAVISWTRIDYKEWTYHKSIHTRLLSLHAFLARFSILMGYIACMFGVWLYFSNYKEGQRGLGNLCIILTLVVTFVFEMIHRCRRRLNKNTQTVNPKLKQISVREFKTRVYKNREKLMIVDNCVL